MTRSRRRDRADTAVPASIAHQGPVDFPLIVHSHLRWDFVWQRPQHVLSRMAEHSPVLFVEEPVFLDDIAAANLDISLPGACLVRAVPRLPATLRNDYDGAMQVVRRLLTAALDDDPRLEHRFQGAVQWFYTPMPAPVMIGAFNERGVVYDCMDELSKFRYAPPDLVHRERYLLANADVVFTGGFRLYEAKRSYHPNVHVFGCGVDLHHFATARDDATVVPPELAALPGPRFGYYGVIDERLDYDLIAQLADQCPSASIVMIGPVTKVDENELPRRENVHWLGRRPYEMLPAYLRGIDVCLMPFALNDATEFINPTKTLEYLAAGRPVVSTAVADVARQFSREVRVSRSPLGFVAAVIAAATVRDPARIAAGIERAEGASWSAIVAEMRALVVTALERAEPHPELARRTPSVTAARPFGGDGSSTRPHRSPRV